MTNVDDTAFTEGKGLVFIGGCPRSGTTLVQRVLNAHPEVYAGPEFDHIPLDILPLREKMRQRVVSGRTSQITSEAEIDKAFQKFVTSIFGAKLQTENKRVFAEKTPANGLALEELAQLFPQAKLIYVVRDPRDVVNSMLSVSESMAAGRKRPPRYLRSASAAIETINSYHEKGLQAQRKQDQIMLLHYEDLVGEPERTAQKICAHVGLTFDPAMLNIENSDFSAPDNSTNWFYAKDSLNAPISKQGVIAAKRRLHQRQIRLVESYVLNDPSLKRYNLTPNKDGFALRAAWSIEQFWRYFAYIYLPKKPASQQRHSEK